MADDKAPAVDDKAAATGDTSPAADGKGAATGNKAPSANGTSPVADGKGTAAHDIKAGPGGVMTDEVGVVTGDLTLRTDVDDKGDAVVKVQYKDAAEWYTVTGAKAHLHDAKDAEAVQKIAVGILNRPEG